MGNTTIKISRIDNVEWLNSSTCLYNLTHVNHIWRIRISDFKPAINTWRNLLTADELERAGRYHREKDKKRFIVSRTALRILLGKYLSVDAKEIAFEIGDNKKPRIKGNSNTHYNVSHSGDYVLIGISSNEIGVDVETIDAKMDFAGIMPISYSETEMRQVNQSPNPLVAFYTIWTRKEALLKATAKGIDDHLKLIPGLDGEHVVNGEVLKCDQNWSVTSFNVNDEHLGSIASGYTENAFWEMLPE